MRLHRPIVFAREPLLGSAQQLGAVAFAHQHFVCFEGACPHPAANGIVTDQQFAVRPARPEQLGGGRRVPFVLGEDPEEIIDPNHPYTGNRLDRALVDV